MAINFNYMFDVAVVILILLLLLYLYYRWLFKNSRNINMPCVHPPRFFWGNMENILTCTKNQGITFKEMYLCQKMLKKKIARFFKFTKLQYFLSDPEYIRLVLKSDFDHFTDRDFYFNEKDDPLSANLFAIDGPRWYPIRNKLSPTFTAGKLKMMFENILQSGLQMNEYIQNLRQSEIEITKIAKSYSMDVIGSCAFGMDLNCFKNPDGEFEKRGREIFEFPPWKVLKVLFAFTYPKFARRIGVTIFGKRLTRFFVGITRDVINYRKQYNIQRKDMMQLLMELHDETGEKNGKLNFEETTAQVFIFFAAGFETSSITLTYSLYELCVNQSIQDKLRQEIRHILSKHDQKITYDSVMEMKYMSQVIDETLRKHTPVPYLFRKCVKDYRFPDTDYVIKKDEVVLIPILGLHHDPFLFSEPDRFDPDRFSAENRSKISSNIYMPFGEGPRICIGLRFALIQLKVALTVLLLNYKFSLSDKTKSPIPVKVFSFTLIPSEKVYFNIEAINET